jgi:hypothetical protein
MISRYTYDSEKLTFVEAKNPQSDLFEVGVNSYLPRECQLKESELLGSGNPYDNDGESDLDEEDDDMMEENERQAFNNEVRQTIDRCVTSHFPISNAIMEVKSLKMTYNMDHSDCLEAFIPPLFDTIKEENAV